MKKELKQFIMTLTCREAQGYVDLGNNQIIKTDYLIELLEKDGYTVERTFKHGIIKVEKEFNNMQV